MRAVELVRLASDWLAKAHPGSVIVEELSIGDGGISRLDIAAITEDRIVGVEIKGQGDSPSRLSLQGVAYPLVAREMWLLPAESIRARCAKAIPPGWGELEVWGGAVRPRNKAVRAEGWVVLSKSLRRQRYVRDDSVYRPSKACLLDELSPSRLCGTLWRDELFEIAVEAGLKVPRRARVDAIRRLIIDKMPVTVLHDHAIRALRRRCWKRPVRDTRLQRLSG